MYIYIKDLLKLPVYSEEEIFLGKITDADLSLDAYSLRNIIVSKMLFFWKFETLLISVTDIISVDNEKVIVKHKNYIKEKVFRKKLNTGKHEYKLVAEIRKNT